MAAPLLCAGPQKLVPIATRQILRFADCLSMALCAALSDALSVTGHLSPDAVTCGTQHAGVALQDLQHSTQ